MAGCYECNHCGKCTHGAIPVIAPIFICESCGRVAEPGDSINKCEACGSDKMKMKMVESTLEN